MKLTEMSSHPSEWFNGNASADIVISSRVRLARNVAGFRFLTKCSSEQKNRLLEKLKDTLLSLRLSEEVFYVGIDDIPPLHAELLVERHLISRQHARGKGPRGVVIDKKESFTAMINEEDHLRIQLLKAGSQLKECWEQISLIDDEIEKRITYAFDRKYGYLTACPTNTGTGIRVSVMLHLPALKMTNQIEKFLNATRDLNLAVRGLFGEGTEATGDFYQLSNQVTLGVSEAETISDFNDRIIPEIVEYERLAREQLLAKHVNIITDKINRAMAILTSAYMMTSHETLSLLSQIRMGVNMKKIEGIAVSTINELFMLTQPAHLQMNCGRKLSAEQRDTLRAEIIRNRLQQN